MFWKRITSLFRGKNNSPPEDRRQKRAREIRYGYITALRGIDILYRQLLESKDQKGARKLMYAKLSIQSTYNRAIRNITRPVPPEDTSE